MASSPFKDRFILKGGLYLSSLYGIDNRATIDIDFLLTKLALERESLASSIESICKIDKGDGVAFRIIDISPIRLDDLYGGFRLQIQGSLENVRQTFDVDVATGDPIVPSTANYEYQCLVTTEKLTLLAYSLESVVAEKMETFLSKGLDNSRSKDLYDLYILEKMEQSKMKKDDAARAFKETCSYRHFEINMQEAKRIVSAISVNVPSKQRWERFAKKSYASNISYEEVMSSITSWVDFLMK